MSNYTFKADDGKTYYYIHRHIKHFEKDAAMTLFQTQKELGYQKAKMRYKANYFQNLQGVNKESLSRLNDAMNRDEIMSALDQAFTDTLNNQISQVIQGYNLEQKLGSAYTDLNKFLNNQNAKDLDSLFKQITDATNLLNTDRSTLMSLIGPNGLYKKHRDLIKLYNAFSTEVATLEGKTLNVSQKRMVSVLKSLQGLTGQLAGGSTDKQSMQRYLTNIFSTQIGEYIVSKGVAESLNISLNEIRKSLSGTSNVEFKEDPSLTNFIQQYGQKGNQVFKTDNSFKDLSIVLNDGSEFVINLGLSTKWYKNVNSSTGVAISSETSFTHRLNQLLTTSQERYYGYNALGLVAQDNSLYAALKAAIVARNIDVLLSGLGAQGDFSQFIVINGEFYSIWQIITLLENFNMGQGTTSGNSDIVTISAVGLNKISELTQKELGDPESIEEAYVRCKQQNDIINQLKLSAHFYPQRLKRALSSKKT